MTNENHDIMQKVTIISLGILGSWTLQDISLWMAVGSGLIGIIYGIVQIAKLLREWYIKERDRNKTNG